VCARERRHEPRDVALAMISIMNEWLRKSLSGRMEAAAFRALVGEVATTPKPGLVDRNNNGAHADMDFFSFIDSAAAILPYFRECALAGFDSGCDPRRLFDSLRHGGKIAERRMLQAAGGVNVHKGIIFSLGVLSAAYGKLYRINDSPSLDDVMNFCRSMAGHLLEDFAGVNAETAASSGERLYARYGITGIRGEVSKGFPHVCGRSLPVLRQTLESGHTMNDAGVAALLTLLACADDTNIIHRSGIAAARRIRKKIADFLASHPSVEDMLRMARKTDAQFIKDNISAGGCADLLAVTYFLYYLIFEPRS
jgi:holo-ACP synthase/triphosphoribosyl-dephospho-CoA synthase